VLAVTVIKYLRQSIYKEETFILAMVSVVLVHDYLTLLLWPVVAEFLIAGGHNLIVVRKQRERELWAWVYSIPFKGVPSVT
jgi:hypothetical protein